MEDVIDAWLSQYSAEQGRLWLLRPEGLFIKEKVYEFLKLFFHVSQVTQLSIHSYTCKDMFKAV